MTPVNQCIDRKIVISPAVQIMLSVYFNPLKKRKRSAGKDIIYYLPFWNFANTFKYRFQFRKRYRCNNQFYIAIPYFIFINPTFQKPPQRRYIKASLLCNILDLFFYILILLLEIQILFYRFIIDQI